MYAIVPQLSKFAHHLSVFLFSFCPLLLHPILPCSSFSLYLLSLLFPFTLCTPPFPLISTTPFESPIGTNEVASCPPPTLLLLLLHVWHEKDSGGTRNNTTKLTCTIGQITTNKIIRALQPCITHFRAEPCVAFSLHHTPLPRLNPGHTSQSVVVKKRKEKWIHL